MLKYGAAIHVAQIYLQCTRADDAFSYDCIERSIEISPTANLRRRFLAHIDTSNIIRGAVWIRPAGGALDKIQKVMHSLHKRGDGPQFPPHVTLLEGLETTHANAEIKLKKL